MHTSTPHHAPQTWAPGGPGLSCKTLPGAPPASPQGQEREELRSRTTDAYLRLPPTPGPAGRTHPRETLGSDPLPLGCGSGSAHRDPAPPPMASAGRTHPRETPAASCDCPDPSPWPRPRDPAPPPPAPASKTLGPPRPAVTAPTRAPGPVRGTQPHPLQPPPARPLGPRGRL
ncbi:basic proline-rich protein-like [Bubalus bubalis]|uniref:basic proline-rich protein-like n=1 Tax=Bubalus bubalis TaxID=89462 RepID=UPI001E1B923C|nr:basic proline-rich protein-like [Bubalus bubalis]